MQVRDFSPQYWDLNPGFSDYLAKCEIFKIIIDWSLPTGQILH
jgi:hypothetical protein